MTSRSTAASRLLTRHFLRRFFENDLISPHVDLHENSAVAGAAVVSVSLFVSVILGGKYLMGASPPGVVAVESVADNLAFLSISMAAMALMAAFQWDALALDERDAANLGTLPIARQTIVRAKLAALVIFAVGFAIALNLFPSFVLQTATTVRMPVGFSGLLRLVFAHAVASMLAGAFGFLAIVALRELLCAVLGGWFTRVSTFLQGALVLACMSALLLAPAAQGSAKSWLRHGFPAGWVVPPVWFLGLEQTLSGGPIANVTGFVVAQRMTEAHERGLASYHANQTRFEQDAVSALLAVAVVLALAAATYAWNMRTLPQPAAVSRRRRSLIATLSYVSARDGVRRAGFAFALRALVRSAPHRLSMAASAALAIALSLGLLDVTDFRPVPQTMLPGSVLAVQTVIVTLLLAGFRRAVRVPAELKANWMLQMTWGNGERRFLSGVKRAAVVGVAWPAVLALVPLHLWLLQERIAIAHLVVGLAYGVVVVEALFVGCTKVPFASSYEPLSHVKTIGPIVFILFLMFVHTFASAERDSLRANGLPNFLFFLAFVLVALRAFEYWRNRTRPPLKFDEPPEPATQWLGLSG